MQRKDNMEADKIYHIYAKGQCIYHSLSEEKFTEVWETMHRMVEVLETNVRKEDLQYEELVINKEIVRNSSY